jgi:hypothetical protein
MLPQTRFPLSLLLAVCAAPLTACSTEEPKVEAAPALGVLELPLAHRNADSAPAGAVRVEVTPSEIRVEGESVLKLENGKIPAAEVSGYELPKLKAKLTGKSALAISTHAATPYATLARVMQTGYAAGAREFAFQVRKPNTTKDTGWLVVKQNHFTESAESGKFEESDLVSWDSFTKVWDESLNACQSSSRGDCGYAPMAKAEGGKLDMMLRVRGSGLAVRMRQTGVPEAAEKPAEKPKPKVEMLEGVKGAAPAEETPPEPSTEHVFTLRADQATITPSPISGITKPVCGSQTCPVVFDAEGISMTVHVLSLLGAAFPDGTPAPKVAWVLPPPL